MEKTIKAPPPRTIKARVKPGNRYGQAHAGDIVDVDPVELELCAHALESLDAEKEREAAKIDASKAEEERLKALADRRAALFAARDAAIQGRKIARERALNRQIEAQKTAAES